MTCKKIDIFKSVNVVISMTITIVSLIEIYKNYDSINTSICVDILKMFLACVCASSLNIFGLLSFCGIGCTKINFIINFIINIILFIYNLHIYWDENYLSDENTKCIDYYKNTNHNIWLLYSVYIFYQVWMLISGVIIICLVCKE